MKTVDQRLDKTSTNELIRVIASDRDEIRNQSLDELCRSSSFGELRGHVGAIEDFWRRSDNLYHQVRALFFLASIHRYHLPRFYGAGETSKIPYAAYRHLMDRRHLEAIDSLLAMERESGPGDAISSGLAQAYHELAFETLAAQVRKSVRSVRGNQWMFRIGHPADHPLRFRPDLLEVSDSGGFAVLAEKTSVRMDFSHSGWSDIFFLGMDYPSGARVINASIDLAVRGRDPLPKPPIECYLRVIDEPVLRLHSIDLRASASLTTIAEVFDFGRDYLGLLKAAVIASGIVPPGMEGCGLPIEAVLTQLAGPGLGLELVSKVNDIPKGSRLAVSTNLLGSLISVCMRATGQVLTMSGTLSEVDRRTIAARAILGEWIGGSGGGWQDSGGVWPGIKLICGAEATHGDAEFGVSRGRLLPEHSVLSRQDVSEGTRQALQDSLVLVHGGMAQNVGPILEMVTEKYLLRSRAEWQARQEAIDIWAKMVESLKTGDIRRLGELTHRNFQGPLQTIIPWCTNHFTNTLITQCEEKFGTDFWGFWMLGGMAGGGMGFIFCPDKKDVAQDWLLHTMRATKKSLEASLPFAMDPVVYDFQINDHGSRAVLDPTGEMPDEYYAQQMPTWLRTSPRDLSLSTRRELSRLGAHYSGDGIPADKLRRVVTSILPVEAAVSEDHTLDEILRRHGFDARLHEQIRLDLKNGRCGLAQNRLPSHASIEDVREGDILEARNGLEKYQDLGKSALIDGKVAVVTLAAGVGSRWTEGAGVVKGLHPFCRMSGSHRAFLEVHLAKSRLIGEDCGRFFPHVITTGYLTHEPIRSRLEETSNFGYPGQVFLSEGRAVGLRMVPMVRDLQFAWEEMSQQTLDEQQEKVRASVRQALMEWARQSGEGSDYRDNEPMQCLHPIGHWYEVPNLLRNGTLQAMLADNPALEHLMLHNVDTLGANVDPCLVGLHIANGACLTFEVISRRLEDTGGGLASVNGQPQLLEGLAMPREEDEFSLSFYNSMTTWIHIDKLLTAFGLSRSDLGDVERINAAVRDFSARMPTYVTLKDVKKRWGHGQEDVFTVSQFEKLWGDMSRIAEIDCKYAVVSRLRGQQLKQQAQLDRWWRDGSAAYVNELCHW